MHCMVSTENLVSKSCLINEKPRITNHSNFFQPSQRNIDEAINHELIPAFTENILYEHTIWTLVNGRF